MIIIELFKLFGSVLIDNAEANKSISATEKKAGGLGAKLGSLIGTAAKVGAGIAAGAGIAGAAMFGMANKASEATSRINDLSEKIGITKTAFQEWDFVANQVGANVEGLQMSVKTLSKVAYEASQGVKTYTDSFDQLGISVTNVDGSLKDQETLLNETIAALAGVEDKTQRTALASELLGRSATDLAPIFNMTAEELENMKGKAHELGIVLSDEAIEAGDEFGDTMDSLKASFGAVGTELGVMFMPALQSLMDWVLEHMPEIKAVIETVFTVVGEVISKTVDILKALYNFVEPSFPTISKIISAAFTNIVGMVQTGIDIFEGLTSAIKTALKWLGQYSKENASSTFASGSGRTHGGGGQAFANGTDFAPGGMALVGERGPEIVNVPRGAQVYTAEETAEMLGGTTELAINLSIPLDGKKIASATSKVQLQNNKGKSRTLGVVLT